jgi:hypothetical protein
MPSGGRGGGCAMYGSGKGMNNAKDEDVQCVRVGQCCDSTWVTRLNAVKAVEITNRKKFMLAIMAVESDQGW